MANTTDPHQYLKNPVGVVSPVRLPCPVSQLRFSSRWHTELESISRLELQVSHSTKVQLWSLMNTSELMCQIFFLKILASRFLRIIFRQKTSSIFIFCKNICLAEDLSLIGYSKTLFLRDFVNFCYIFIDLLENLNDRYKKK